MRCELHYDTFDIEAETLDALMPSLAEGKTSQAAYPFPMLQKSGRRAILSLRTAVLSNEYIQATIGIDLGGRLLALRDKRTGLDVIPLPKALDLVEGGSRGVEWRHGVEVALGHNPRPTAMGPMEHLARASDNEDNPAELILHEIIAGTGLGLQLTWLIFPGVAELELEIKLLNRTLNAVPGVSSLLVHFGEPVLDCVWHDAERQAGISVRFDPEAFDARTPSGCFRRALVAPELEPHQVDAFRIQIQPITGLPGVTAASRSGALHLGSELYIQPHASASEAKALLQLESGQRLEAPIEFVPGPPMRFDLTTAPGLIAVAVLDAAKKNCLFWSAKPVREEDAGPDPAVLETRLAGKRGSAYLKLAIRALREKKWAEADRLLEESLLFNGDDPLTWWLKAMAKRLGGEHSSDCQELLNAHYLAPLEPALRAEAFLQQNVRSAEPSPLMAPLAKNPEAVMDVACLLIEAGLFEEASRFMDEALRHRELMMLRALTAWLLVDQSRMAVDAANQIARLEAAPWEPPFPWRRVERDALDALALAFPDSDRVRRLRELAKSATTDAL